MIEKVISPLKDNPLITRILDCLILGFFVVNPISMIIIDKAHNSLTHEQLRLMNESISVSLAESMMPEFWIFSVFITTVTIIVGLGLKLKDLKNKRIVENYFLTRQRIITQTLNSVDHPIFQIDLNLKFAAINNYYSTLLGYADANQIIGRNYREFYDKANVDALENQIQNVLRIGRPVEYVFDSTITDTGKIKRILNPVKDASGEIKGIVVEAYKLEKSEQEGIVTICSYCKSVRIDDAFVPVETILPTGLGYKPSFSHGICPECYEKVKEDIEQTTN